MKQKRIICTVTNDLTYDQRMIRICTALVEMEYEVLLVGRQQKHSKPLISEVFQQQRFNCWFNKGIWFYLEYNIRLFLFLLFAKVEILYAVDLDTILPNYLISRIRRKPCIYDAHEYFTEVPELVNRPQIKAVWERIAQWTIPNIQYGITVGTGLAKIFEERYGLAFTVVRNVPFQQANEGNTPKHDPPVLLYQGALNDGRGIEEMIESMQYLEDVVLWLVGEGDLSALLRSSVQELQLDHKVKFLGYQTPKKLKQITPQATIGINLLQNKGLNYYYSLANKAFDYVQAGVPSISMRFPEYEALNREYEVFELVNDLEVNTLVQAVGKLLTDRVHYKKLVENCQQAAVVWHWGFEKQQLLELMRRVGNDN